MQRRFFGRTRARAVCAIGLSFALTLGLVPVPAFAERSDEIRAELENVQSRLETLSIEAEQTAYELQSTTARLNETNASIDELNVKISKTGEELKTARDELSLTVSWSYKARPSFFSLILSSSSFDELISNVYYANKVSESQTEQVTHVLELQAQQNHQMAELETNKAEQETLLAEQEDRNMAAQMAVANLEEYSSQLSDEMRKALAEEEAARAEAARREAERRAAEMAAAAAAAEAQRAAEAEAQRAQEEAARRAQQEAERAQEGASSQEAEGSAEETTSARTSATATEAGTSTSSAAPEPSSSASSAVPDSSDSADEADVSSPGDTDDEEADVSSVSDDSTNDWDGSYGASLTTPTYTPSPSGSVTEMVQRAYSIIGSGYQWSGYVWTGSTASSAFTCSGVVDYALGRSTNSSWPESLYAEVGSRMVSSTSQLQYGDLVFYSYGGRSCGHVGIYIGGGSIIDSVPSGGVSIRDVNYMPFIGGGPIL